MRPRILTEAEDKLLEAMLYYKYRHEGLGTSFYASVDETILAIANDPLRFPFTKASG